MGKMHAIVTDPQAKERPEKGLLALRKGLGVFANRARRRYTLL